MRARARSTSPNRGCSTTRTRCNLASQPPRDADELFERTKGLRALRGPQRQELLDLLQAPLSDEDLDIAPIPAPLE